jgi:hypothetical protein
MWTQILLPIILASILFTALIVAVSLATFRGTGDVSRWAAISTIWLTLPVIAGGVAALVVLCTLIFLLGRLTRLIPPYSYQAQRYVFRLAGGVKRGLEMAVRPMLLLKAVGGEARRYIARQWESFAR